MPKSPPSNMPTLRKNRSCQLCRVKKAKCDDRQPICGICRSQNHDCTYEQDRRQVSRVSQSTVHSLQNRLDEIEGSVGRLESSLKQLHSRRPSVLTPATCAEGSEIGALSPDEVMASFDEIEGSHNAEITTINHNDTHLVPNPSGNDNQPHTVYPHTASNSVTTHILVQNQGHTSMYGPSSTFHMPISPTSMSVAPSSRSISCADQDNESTEALRCRLFMRSALEIQKEWTYMTERKFDLDGFDPELAWHFFQLHWSHHHRGYLMTYRPAVMHSLATKGPYINKLLLNAIYFSSALNSDRRELYGEENETRSFGWKFYLRVQQLLPTELEKSSIATAAGLITVGSSLVSNGQQTAGWHYSGMGYRMIIDLGLHTKTDQNIIPGPFDASKPLMNFTDMYMEWNRRLFWGAYINDKFQSLYFGRPPSLNAVGVEHPRTPLDTYEELEPWTPYIDPQVPSPILSQYIPQPAYTISTFTSFIDLAEIAGDIIHHLYVPEAQAKHNANIPHELKRIKLRLDDWKLNLAKHLVYKVNHDPVPPAHRFNPLMTFQMLHILLYRPFVHGGHLRHIKLDIDDHNEPRDLCKVAAFEIYELEKAYRRQFTLRRAPYMFSYALFSAASIIPSQYSEGEESSDVLRKEVAGFFWTALKELQRGANLGLRKPLLIVRSLFERAGLDLDIISSQRANDSGAGEHSARNSFDQTVLHNSELENTNSEAGPAGHWDIVDHQDTSVTGSGFDGMFRDIMSGSLDEVLNMSEFETSIDSDMLYGLFRDNPC